MDSIIYPGTDILLSNRVGNPPESLALVDLSSQNELYQRNVLDRKTASNVRRPSERCAYEPQQSSSSTGEMNFREVPVVGNSFSLPRSVFERALVTQTCVSITAPSSDGFASPFLNDSAAHHFTAGHQQRRRPSGDYVTELTGSEAKRPRLSPPTLTPEQDFAQRRHDKKLEREQLKLQILRRLDHTKDNILKLLKLQHMQGFVHYYEKDPRSNQAERSGSFQRSGPPYHSRQGSAYERQYRNPTSAPVQNDHRSVSVAPKQNVFVPNIVHQSAQDINRPTRLPSSSHSFRRVPGISIVTNGVQSNEQRTSYSYKSSDSVGLAWDHKALPKIVAVHSVINDASVNTTKTAGRPEVRRSHAVGRPDYAHGENEARQNQLRSPVASLQSEVNDRVTAVTDGEDHEAQEVVVTKVLPGRARRSISTERKRVEANFTNCNERSADEKEHRSPNGVQVNRHNFAKFVLGTSSEDMETAHHLEHVEHSALTKNAAHVEHSRHSNHPGRTEHSRHIDYPGHVEHPGLVDHTGHIDHTRESDTELVEKTDLTNALTITDSSVINDELPTSVSQTGTAESQCVDAEIYLGGPPPYLPVLDSSKMAKQEKERRSPPVSGERRGSNPTSPRLTKTIPEISEKIIETRERIKNETIEWKKKILYRLEKRLMKKLRRAESATGQKTEMEDLREEGPDKGKKSRSPSLDRRSSGAESVTDSVTDDDEHTLQRSENLPQESESVMEPGDESHECPQEDKNDKDFPMEETDNWDDVSAEKRDENKQVEIPCAEEEKTEHCKNSTRLIKQEIEEEYSKRLCNGFEEPLTEDEEQRRVESDVDTNKVDCVTNEHCRETKFPSEAVRKSGSETSGTSMAKVVQYCEAEKHSGTELSESSREKSPQPLQRNDDKKESVTFVSSPNEKPRVRTQNVFEAFSSEFQAPALEKDKLRLPETTEESALIMTQEKSSSNPETKKPDKPAETKKPIKKDVKILTKLSSLKRRLETCGKEVLKKKTETVGCDRNIWSVLRRDDIF